MSTARKRGLTGSGIAAGLAASTLLAGAGAAQAAPDIYDPSVYLTAPDSVTTDASEEATTVEKAEEDLRVATLNANLTAGSPEELIEELEEGSHPKARVIAETVQINSPDVLVLTNVSYDEQHEIAELINEEYLAAGQNGQDGLDYPYIYTAGTNSGLDSGADLDGDGMIGGPEDALGYGTYPGEYGMVLFSSQPIIEDEVRTFQEFKWQDMPDNSLPEGEFSDLEQSVLRLSGVSLWDVPIELEGTGEHVHVIANAMNPAGTKDELGEARTEDERRMVADYISQDPSDAWYLYDDEGGEGGLAAGEKFVVAGQPAAEPISDDGDEAEEGGLLDSSALQDPEPEAVTEAPLSNRPGSEHGTDGQATRAVPEDEDIRASYALPSATLDVTASGVFWPAEGEFGFSLVDPSSSYALADRLVWVDVDKAAT